MIHKIHKHSNDTFFVSNPIQEEREKQVEKNLPELFTTKYQSVLYIGANQKRQHFVDRFEKSNYNEIVILEVFKENFEFLKTKFNQTTSGIFDVIHGDVRDIDKILKKTFDVVFFWHGIEHLNESEIESILKKLERISKVVVLGLPYGKYEQGPEYGNPFEEHLSAIYPSFLENLGYKTDVLGKPDKKGSNIMAWKFVE
jgi:hypothetical protein